MANQTRRLHQATLKADKNALAALKNLPNYQPINPGYLLASVLGAHDTMHLRQEEATQKQIIRDDAYDSAVAAEWAFHNAMLGVKEQVRAQFGADSNEVQALGLVKKSPKKPTGVQGGAARSSSS